MIAANRGLCDREPLVSLLAHRMETIRGEQVFFASTMRHYINICRVLLSEAHGRIKRGDVMP